MISSELINSLSAHDLPTYTFEEQCISFIKSSIIYPLIERVINTGERCLSLIHMAFLWLYVPFPIRFIAYAVKAHSIFSRSIESNDSKLINEIRTVLKLIRSTTFLNGCLLTVQGFLALSPTGLVSGLPVFCTAFFGDFIVQRLEESEDIS